jgi:MFS family permease
MAMMESSPGSGRLVRRPPVDQLAVVALLALVAVAFADSSIVVLALPDLLRAFDVSITGVAWVVTAYNLSLAVVALLYTRLRPQWRDPVRAARVGALVFLAASLGCAFAPSVWLLVGLRAVQGVGAGLLLVGALPVARRLVGSAERGTALWAGAGVVGAAVGPALGGLLTGLFSWQGIFLAQVPVAAVGLLALLTVSGRFGDLVPVNHVTRMHRHAASLALALVSAATVGLLFLAVVELIDVWRLTPFAAAAVVSVIPLATLAAGLLSRRVGPAVTPGTILLAAGLAGMGFLPANDLLWVIAALALAGAGLGFLLPALTGRVLSNAGPSSVGAAHTVWIRHAGLVAGILLLSPLLVTDLASAGQSAKLRGISVVLQAPVSVGTKAQLALDVAPVLARPPRKQLPDFEATLRPGHDAALTRIGRELDQVVQATITRGFRRSYLLAALLGLVALVPLAFLRAEGGRRLRSLRAAVLAGAAATALIGGELAGGAQAFGTQPRLEAACAASPAKQGSETDARAQRLALEGLDFIACRLHKNREQLLLDVAAWGYEARGDLSAWAHRLHLPFG